jgi:hypothetical protein
MRACADCGAEVIQDDALECPKCGRTLTSDDGGSFSETAWFKVGDDVKKILESTDDNLDVEGLDDEYTRTGPADTETRRQYSLDNVPVVKKD